MTDSKLKIYYTSDTHGCLFPVDYATGELSEGGLLALAAQIKKDADTLVLDGGDSLQGTPLVQYYLEHRQDFSFHPVAEAFRAMGLDYYTLGNHDFNFGYEVLRDYVKAMPGKCLCANVQDLRGELGLTKTVVHTLSNGLRVGLTGVVTDHVNVWESEAHLEGLLVTEPLAAAGEALKSLKGRCDLTICIYHGGYEEDLSTGKLLSQSRENIACRMGRELDFDLLLTGHQHMAVPGVVLDGTCSAQPPDKAKLYAYLEASIGEEKPLSEDENTLLLIGVRWRFSASLRPVGGACQAQPYGSLLPLEEKTELWLDEPIGTFQEELAPEEKLEAALGGSRVAALFNQVQLEETGADFSCTSLSNEPMGFPKEVSIRDVYAAYRFANTSEVKQVTREVLKEALEHCASYFSLDESGQPCISDYFLRPKVEHYNYDFYGGLDYAFDLRRPVGDRVVRLKRLDGRELSGEETYTLVTSNYRATGTGGYEMIGRCLTVYSGADNMQDLLVNYIRTHSPLKPIRNARFRVIW